MTQPSGPARANTRNEAVRWAICDVAGFHDEFTSTEVKEWLEDEFPRSRVGTTLNEMVRWGHLTRVRHGLYKWGAPRTLPN